jgi:aminomethyltransferase
MTSPSVAKATPLHDIHQRLGATLTDFAGWSMPLKYTSQVAEHHAVRHAAGLFDLSHMGELELSGPEAGATLDYALVSRPSGMRVGQARYSMLVSADGGILDDLVVYRLDEEKFLVVANAANVATVHKELVTRAAGHRTEVRNASADWSLIAVQGPSSPQIVAEATGDDVSGLTYYSVARAKIGTHDVLLARTGYTGEDGFEVYCAAGAAAEIWSTLSDLGSPRGLVPAGLACRDSLRLEAGMPLYGQELTSDVNPFDVGLGRVVVFDKPGGSVGADALAAARDADRARRLIGLSSVGRRAPRTGHAVLRPGTGERIGTVTSGVPSPTLGHAVAMAIVDADDVEPGTALEIDVRGRTEQVEVVKLPFYRRDR